MKKQIILYAGIALLAMGCDTNPAKKQGGLTINIKNVPAQEIRLMRWDGSNTQAIAIDTVQYNGNGPVNLSMGALPEQSYMVLEFDQNRKASLPLVSSGESITINGDYNQMQDADVKGSAATTELLDFFKKTSERRAAINKMQKTLDSMAGLKTSDSGVLVTEKAMLELVNTQLAEKKSFVATTQNPVNAVFALQTMTREEQRMLKPQVDSLVLRFPQSDFIKKAQATFAAFINDAPPAPPAPPAQQATGTAAKEISLPDVNGKNVTLSSFRGKYVLIDFWASWCGPCRGENPNVVAAYNKFKNKNFTILGVSLDRDKASWLQAIKDDGLAWTQVSDLKFWQSQAAQDYGIQSIPANYLVDPNGNIIADNLRGAALEQKLAEVLK